MATRGTTRTIRCAYCGQTTTLPCARGPAPIYCSPAHRQAAYRRRRREHGRTPGSTPSAMSVRHELEALRRLLEDAVTVDRWAEARRLLVAGLVAIAQQSSH